VVSDYTDWKLQLTDLENKLIKLKKYEEGGEKQSVIKNYSTIEQRAFKKLIGKIEAKVKEWNLEKSKSEKDSSSQGDSSWYKTPIGIMGIILVIVMLGIITYFVKQKRLSSGKKIRYKIK